MPSCEMCGREAPVRLATVEGTKMQVCSLCVKFGVEVVGQGVGAGRSRIPQALDDRAARQRPADIFQASETELVEDFGKRVRDGRQRKGLTQEELARKLNERQSILSKVEAGTQRPTEDLARRLQRELGITLFEQVAVAEPERRTSTGGTFTLGDLIKREKPKG